MYRGDSFLTLSVVGQAGLVVLSVLLAMAMVAGIRRLVRHRRLPVRALIALTGFFLFEWFSPQIYYLYYILLIGVPWQVVIGAPPGPGDLVDLLAFSGPSNLSAHARGALAWALLAAALLPFRRRVAG